MMVTVIGVGEIGRVFVRAASVSGEGVRTVRRGDDPVLASEGEGPVIVAVREGDLEPLVPKLTPIAPRCVFVQNGWLEDTLRPLGSEIGRGFLWFTAKGDFFRVLRSSPFFGPMSNRTADLLNRAGIAAHSGAGRAGQAELEDEYAYKLAWNCVVGLPLFVRKTTLGAYLVEHESEARAIVGETCAVLSAAFGRAIDARAAFDLLRDTTEPLGWMTGSNKAVDFRNGAIVRLGRANSIPTPVNEALVARS
jgi:ketopantoate reductase